YHLAEHHATPLGMAPVPGIFLAAATQRTRRIRLGPCVYCLPLYDPLRLIEEICMLDQISRGRFDLGVGRGIVPYEMAYFDLHPFETEEIYREALEVILAGLTNEVLEHRGPRYTYRKVPMVLRPFQKPHPPLWYGLAHDCGSTPIRLRRDFDEARQRGLAVAGTASRVREELERQIAVSTCTYLVIRPIFGDVSEAQASASTDRFASEVLPHLSALKPTS